MYSGSRRRVRAVPAALRPAGDGRHRVAGGRAVAGDVRRQSARHRRVQHRRAPAARQQLLPAQSRRRRLRHRRRLDAALHRLPPARTMAARQVALPPAAVKSRHLTK